MNILHRQRGAIGIFGALTLMLAILFAALAVDTGRLLMQQRHLQTVADMAALDASGQSGSCGNQDINAIRNLANASATRNNYQGEPLGLRFGQVTVQNGLRHFNDSSLDTATAIHVQANQTVPASLFAGGLLGRETTLSAEAVAERNAIAALSAGTKLLTFSTQQSRLLNQILNGILGDTRLNLSALSYEGIAGVDLQLIKLVDAATEIGTVNELLTTELSVAEILTIYLDALSEVNGVDATVEPAMQEVIRIATASDLSLKLGDVLNLTTQNPESAANASVNLLDLIMTTLMVANGQNAIHITPSVNILGLAGLSATIEIIEPPQIAIGPPGWDSEAKGWRTHVQTAQLKLGIQADIGRSLNILPLILSDVEVKIGLGLSVDVAKGEAWLKEIQCVNPSSSNTIVTIGAQPTIVSVGLTENTGIRVSAVLCPTLICLTKVRLDIVEVLLGLGLNVGRPDSEEVRFSVNIHDEHDLPKTESVSTRLGPSLGNLLGDTHLSLDLVLLNLNVLRLLGIDRLLEALLQPLLTTMLSGILEELGNELIDPLLQVLGIEAGVIDVTLMDVEIDRPELKR